MSEKMAVRVEARPRSTIDAFAVQHGLTMVVVERSERLLRDVAFVGKLDRFYAEFENADIKGDGVLMSAFGNGETHDKAIENYGRRISEEILVIDAYSTTRREIMVPIIVPMEDPR